MGKAALIAIAGFIVVGAIHSFSTRESTSAASDRVAEFQYRVLAQNAAQVGHNRAAKLLAEQVIANDYYNKDFSGEYEGIPYKVQVDWNSAQEEVTVNVEATAMDGEGNEIKYRMRSRYEKALLITGEIASKAPKFMQYAILADDRLEIKGNVDVEFTAVGDEANKLNANIHSNEELVVNGNSASVRGFGTSAESVTAKDGVFDPYDSEGDGTDVTTSVEIPDFNPWAYVEKLGGPDEESTGILEITGSNGDVLTTNQGTITLDGTRTDPFVWYIDGELRITGNIEVPGYVLFIAEDGFTIAGNVTVGEVDYDASVESNIGIYTDEGGDINLSGSGMLYAQIFAGKNVNIDISGSADLYGSITTRGTVTLSGTPFLHYRPASPALTRAWQNVETQVMLMTHSEW